MRDVLNSLDLTRLSKLSQNLILTAQLDFCSGVERTERYIRLQFFVCCLQFRFYALKIYSATRLPNFCFTSDCVDIATEVEKFLSSQIGKSRAIHPFPKGRDFLGGVDKINLKR